MNRTFIIAEAGVNHNGDIALACRLIDAAKEAGADAVKFQTFRADSLVTKLAPKADYQSNNLGESVSSQHEMLKRLELTNEQFIRLSEYAKNKGIQFLSTPFDNESADFLEPLVSLYKIASCDCTNYPLLMHVAKKRKPMILSTGMADLDEVKEAITTIKQECNDLTVLHCTTNYPCPLNEVNLKAMLTIKNEFGVPVGYSDHTEGIEIPVAAVAMGAVVIEKHFTLDRSLPGPDHKASLNPAELQKMVHAIRQIEIALGDGDKRPKASEINVRQHARRSIVAAVDLPAGVIICEDHLNYKRPGLGLPPGVAHDIIGRKLKISLSKDQMLTFDMLEER